MNVLIFSELTDMSTNNVVDWLERLGHHVFRINNQDVINNVSVNLNDTTTNITFKVRGIQLNLNDIDRVWYRRGHLMLDDRIEFPENINPEIKNAIIHNLFIEELPTLQEFIEDHLSDKPYLGNNFQRSSNKLIALQKAKAAGLQIPSSIVGSQKEALSHFYSTHDNDCISKGVQDILSFTVKKKGYHYTTSKIEREDLEEMSDSFFPSLLQQYIEKKYELRIVYLKERFFAMAIFSQNDEKTRVDFRNYNDEKPNRNVPFILPQNIERQLKTFMQSMNLDSGSIDMIVTPDNNYIFLEVNPSGQYGMTSIPCGYNLDFEIAQEIISTNA